MHQLKINAKFLNLKNYRFVKICRKYTKNLIFDNSTNLQISFFSFHLFFLNIFLNFYKTIL